MPALANKFTPQTRPAQTPQLLADHVEQAIRNGHPWPTTRAQWRRTCQRLGLQVWVTKQPMLWGPGITWDRTIIVTSAYGEERMLHLLCHEVAEALQDQDDHPPITVPPATYNPHKIARIVETRYAAYLKFHHQSQT